MSAAGLFAIGVGLSGCGLKGPLYMPTVPEAANRATLPSLILPSTRSDAAKTAPAAPADAAAEPADAAVTPPAAASSAPASTGVAK